MDSTSVFLSIFTVVFLSLVIGAIVYFFYDDRNRVKARAAKKAADNEARRAILGEFANVEQGQMTPDIEARMTQEQKELWNEYIVLLQLQKKEEALALDLFGPEPAKHKLKKFFKMVGIVIGILVICIIGLALDDALGLRPMYDRVRYVPTTILIGVGIYLLYLFVKVRAEQYTVKRKNKA